MAASIHAGQPRWLDFVPALLWAGLIVLLSTRPSEFFDPVAPAHGTGGMRLVTEVLVHFGQFSVFFLLVRWALGRRGLSGFAAVSASLAAVIGLSLLNESVQAFTITRMFDLFDIAVDVTAGTTMALGTAAAYLPRQSAWTPDR